MSDERLLKFNGPNWNLYIYCHDGDYSFFFFSCIFWAERLRQMYRSIRRSHYHRSRKQSRLHTYSKVRNKVPYIFYLVTSNSFMTILDLYQQYFVYIHVFIRTWWGATHKNEVNVTLTFVSMSQSSRWASVLLAKTSKTWFGPVNSNFHFEDRIVQWLYFECICVWSWGRVTFRNNVTVTLISNCKAR